MGRTVFMAQAATQTMPITGKTTTKTKPDAQPLRRPGAAES